MKLDILRADPAGNITLFVFTAVPREMRAAAASALMAKKELAAEQVAFVTEPQNAGSNGRFEMMGGEFCGNATRAFALYLATLDKEKKRSLTIEVSGCDRPVIANADPEKGTASAEMPLPKIGGELVLAGFDCIRVDLDGISHLVAECAVPNDRLINAAAGLFEADESIAAYGVIFLDRESLRITPAVTVKATKSLVWEGSCGSGSVAAAAAMALSRPAGVHRFELSQPSGSITAEIEKRGDRFVRASIGGGVILGERMQIEI